MADAIGHGGVKLRCELSMKKDSIGNMSDKKLIKTILRLESKLKKSMKKSTNSLNDLKLAFVALEDDLLYGE